jgi:hypothetical protein
VERALAGAPGYKVLQLRSALPSAAARPTRSSPSSTWPATASTPRAGAPKLEGLPDPGAIEVVEAVDTEEARRRVLAALAKPESGAGPGN